jgi:hypothetical protein
VRLPETLVWALTGSKRQSVINALFFMPASSGRGGSRSAPARMEDGRLGVDQRSRISAEVGDSFQAQGCGLYEYAGEERKIGPPK